MIGTADANVLDGGTGNDVIFAGDGADVVVYTSGNDTIGGQNFGWDTLDLGMFMSYQVSFRVHGFDVFVDTPDGTIKLVNQRRYDPGDSRSNIELLSFSDVLLDEAGILQRALSDQGSEGNDVELTALLTGVSITSSSVYSASNPASDLIDGVTGGSNWSSTNNGANEWYEIDLQDTYSLTSIVVTARSTYGSRIEGAEVTLLNNAREVVHTFSPISGSGDGTVHALDVSDFVDARYVRLSQSGEYFNLSEVQVFALSSEPTLEMNATTEADSFVFSDLSGMIVINDFEVGVDLLSVEGTELTGTALNTLPAEFTVSNSANGSVIFDFSDQGSIRLEGVTENEFFFV